MLKVDIVIELFICFLTVNYCYVIAPIACWQASLPRGSLHCKRCVLLEGSFFVQTSEIFCEPRLQLNRAKFQHYVPEKIVLDPHPSAGVTSTICESELLYRNFRIRSSISNSGIKVSMECKFRKKKKNMTIDKRRVE